MIRVRIPVHTSFYNNIVIIRINHEFFPFKVRGQLDPVRKFIEIPLPFR